MLRHPILLPPMLRWKPCAPKQRANPKRSFRSKDGHGHLWPSPEAYLQCPPSSDPYECGCVVCSNRPLFGIDVVVDDAQRDLKRGFCRKGALPLDVLGARSPTVYTSPKAQKRSPRSFPKRCCGSEGRKGLVRRKRVTVPAARDWRRLPQGAGGRRGTPSVRLIDTQFSKSPGQIRPRRFTDALQAAAKNKTTFARSQTAREST